MCDQDGRNWKLLTPMVYRSRDGRVFVVPRGASTDGASTPALIASLLPPTGAYWQSAVLHDSFYRGTIQNQDGTPANIDKNQSDDLFLEAMQLSGVDEITANTLYEGVRLAGGAYFRV